MNRVVGDLVACVGYRRIGFQGGSNPMKAYEWSTERLPVLLFCSTIIFSCTLPKSRLDCDRLLPLPTALQRHFYATCLTHKGLRDLTGVLLGSADFTGPKPRREISPRFCASSSENEIHLAADRPPKLRLLPCFDHGYCIIVEVLKPISLFGESEDPAVSRWPSLLLIARWPNYYQMLKTRQQSPR